MKDDDFTNPFGQDAGDVCCDVCDGTLTSHTLSPGAHRVLEAVRAFSEETLEGTESTDPLELLGKVAAGMTLYDEKSGREDDNRLRAIQEYSSKPLREFLQVDGFNMAPGADDCLHPDEDGHCIMAQRTSDLQRTDCAVRVRVRPGTDKAAAAAMLRKIAAWVEKPYPLGPEDIIDCHRYAARP